MAPLTILKDSERLTVYVHSQMWKWSGKATNSSNKTETEIWAIIDLWAMWEGVVSHGCGLMLSVYLIISKANFALKIKNVAVRWDYEM